MTVPSPQDYIIPSRAFNAQGKTFGMKYLDAEDSPNKKYHVPGPGQYSIDKLPNHNYSFSMG